MKYWSTICMMLLASCITVQAQTTDLRERSLVSVVTVKKNVIPVEKQVKPEGSWKLVSTVEVNLPGYNIQVEGLKIKIKKLESEAKRLLEERRENEATIIRKELKWMYSDIEQAMKGPQYSARATVLMINSCCTGYSDELGILASGCPLNHFCWLLVNNPDWKNTDIRMVAWNDQGERVEFFPYSPVGFGGYTSQVYVEQLERPITKLSIEYRSHKAGAKAALQRLKSAGVILPKPLPGLLTGKTFPASASFPTFDNKMVSLYAYKGKFILLDFFAGWCAPCVTHLVDVVNLSMREDIKVLLINVGESKEKVKKTLQWVSESPLEKILKRHYGSAKGGQIADRIKREVPHQPENGMADVISDLKELMNSKPGYILVRIPGDVKRAFFEIHGGLPRYVLLAPNFKILFIGNKFEKMEQVLKDVLK